MNHNGCYQPTHNLDISNPPQGGSGYPSKSKLDRIREHLNGLTTTVNDINNELKDIQTKLNESEKQNNTGFNVSNLTNDELAIISFALNHLPASAYISDRLLDTWLSMCNVVNNEEVKRGI